jgi:hypothetical protein
MNTTFKVDGCYEVEVRSDGHMPSRNGLCDGMNRGHVSLMVHYQPMGMLPPQPVSRMDRDEFGAPTGRMLPVEQQALPPVETPVAFYLTPNRARAIASALLTAAQEAKGS